MSNRRTVVVFPVFHGYEVRIIVAKDMAATGKRLGQDLAKTCGAVVTSDDQPMQCWLVLRRDADITVMTHEAYHAIKAMFKAVGANDDEETFAFHLGHLVGRVHKFMKKGKR